ncbi:MAG: DEAD/DEAH box helicase [Spirochaetia bacterium]
MKLTELELSPEVQKGIQNAGFTDCTDVQEKTLVHSLNNRDVCVQSQTGTGKTAAFLITMLHGIHTEKIHKTIIIVPTRELALQIEKEARLLEPSGNLNICCIFGGVGYGKQEQCLRNNPNIVIGTPGRLMDFEQKRLLKFSEFDMTVIDEADRLFDMGFLADIRKMLKKMPPPGKRQTMLFSATLTTRAKHLAWEHMNDPAEVIINPKEIAAKNVEQCIYHVQKNEKMQLLLGILAKYNPENALIFTNTKQSAYEVSNRLEENGIPTEYIIGDLPQKKRSKIIEDIKDGRIKFLCATDVAARGLHIDDLDLVVNYDLPEDPENYVHRIGRTGRAGESGHAVSLGCEQYVYSLEAIQEMLEEKIPVEWANEQMYLQDKSEGMRFNLRDEDRKGKKGNRRDSNRKRSDNKRSKKPEGNRKQSSTKEKITAKTDQRKQRKPQKQAAQKPESRKATKQKEQARPPKDLKNSRDINKRVEYYKQKYGEDFTVKESSETADNQPKANKSILQKIISVFK